MIRPHDPRKDGLASENRKEFLLDRRIFVLQKHFDQLLKEGKDIPFSDFALAHKKAKRKRS